jgi:acyl-CoA hydrolase
VRAANASPGGASIVLLPAGRIVERLSGPVSIPRSEAGIIVTERGAADLRGRSLKERQRLIQALATR